MIDIFRKAPLMYFFSKLDSIRESRIGFLDVKDEPEEMKRLQLYKEIINHKICLSECFDTEKEIYLKASFPDKLPQLNGSSGFRVTFKVFYWKNSDIEQIFKKQTRAEYRALDATNNLQNKVNELSKADDLNNSTSMGVQPRFLKNFLSGYEV